MAVYWTMALLWALTYMIVPQYAVPQATLMRMIFLFVGAHICGYVVQLLRLPDMLGMIFWGVLYTNIGLGNFEGYEGFEAKLR